MGEGQPLIKLQLLKIQLIKKSWSIKNKNLKFKFYKNNIPFFTFGYPLTKQLAKQITTTYFSSIKSIYQL